MPSGPTIWSDATWAPDYGTYYDNYRSTSGIAVSGNSDGSNLLSWNANRQPIVALSSSESEWYAAAEAAKDAAYVKDLFQNFGLPNQNPTTLFCDNQSTIKQSMNKIDARNSRHIGMRAHYLRFQCHSGRLHLQFIPSQEQLADAMTKLLPMSTHEKLRKSMGVMRRSEFMPVPVTSH